MRHELCMTNIEMSCVVGEIMLELYNAQTIM